MDALQLLGDWMTVMVPALFEELVDELILDEVEYETKMMVEEAVEDTLAEARAADADADADVDGKGDGDGESDVPNARARLVDEGLVDESWRDALAGRLNPINRQYSTSRRAPPATAAAGRRADPPVPVQKSSSCALL